LLGFTRRTGHAESYFPALDCRRNRQAEKPGPETSGKAQIAAQLGGSRSATSVKAHDLKLSLRMRRQTTEAPSRSGADPGPAGFDWHE
jgi:hypothetical protein